MSDWHTDPDALVPRDLDEGDSRTYEEQTVEALRQSMIGNQGGLLEVEAIELAGSRPDTLVVFRYRYRPQYVGRDPRLVAEPQAEVASLWEFAIDTDDGALMDPPSVLAAAIGSAFEASEMMRVDPETLAPIGHPPAIFPRCYDLAPPPRAESS